MLGLRLDLGLSGRQAGGGAPAFDPASVLVGASGIGYDRKTAQHFTDAGVTPASNGQAVYRWTTLTNSVSSFIDNATGAQQMLLAALGMVSDGVDDWYPTFTIGNTNGPYFHFEAFYMDLTGASQGFGMWNGTGQNALWETANSANVSYWVAGTNAVNAVDIRGNGYHSVGVSVSGTAGNLTVVRYIDGVSVGSDLRTGSLPTTFPMSLGSVVNANTGGSRNAFFKGTKCGALWGNRAPSATEFLNLHNYWKP